MTKRLISLAFLLAVAGPAAAETPSRPLVLELYTSQGCSSCPPADALLGEYATRPDLLPLAFHVEYWNRLGWRDPFSSAAATARQRAQAGRLGDGTIYTPELVVEGATAVVGSDRAAVAAAISSARARAVSEASVRLRRTGPGELEIAVGSGAGRAAVILLGYDAAHTTPVGRGENGGRVLREFNIVRSFATVAEWRGQTLELRRPAPEGEHFAVLLETQDGRIVGAARAEP